MKHILLKVEPSTFDQFKKLKKLTGLQLNRLYVEALKAGLSTLKNKYDEN